MNGYLDSLTNEQSSILKKFKENLKDVLKEEHNDSILLKWLRARKFDIVKSEDMFRKSLKWREEFRIDYVANEWTPPEVLSRYYTGGFHGYDKEGSPVYIKPAGLVDVKGVFASASKADIIRYNIRDSERALVINSKNSIKHGRYIEKMVLIIDMKNYGMKDIYKPFVDLNNEMLGIFEANYPENLKTTYVINTPSVFPIIYSIAKPFLAEETKKKINLLGKNWKREILKVIDADQLPVQWGGTVTDEDGDPCCSSKVCMGGKVPKSYYSKTAENMDLEKFTKVDIGRSSSFSLDFTIDRIGTLLEWQYLTKNSDIGFSLKCRPVAVANDNNNHDGCHGDESASQGDLWCRAYQRVNCHLVPEDERIVCEHTGTYTFTFDNKFSWTKGKRLYYQINVTPPTEEYKELHTSPSFMNP